MFLLIVTVILCFSIPTFYGFEPYQGKAHPENRNYFPKVVFSYLAHPDADVLRTQKGLNTKKASYDYEDHVNRRNFVASSTKWMAAPCSSVALFPTMTGGSKSNNPKDAAAFASSSIRCLQDLPPYDPKTTVRLYLCRHGETENNRLNIIQGARVDPPINRKGIQQAKLLGLALSFAVLPPSLVVHSPLLRAKQTAHLVAEQLRARNSEERIEMRTLNDLAEVDFGSMAEGSPVSQYRLEMISLYTSWAFGYLNARMPGGGESGYEVRK
jgi:hypothetical protein